MSAADWTTIDQPQDIRLVVADMDGTLLDEHGRIPEGFWDMLARRAGFRPPVRHAAQHVRFEGVRSAERGRAFLYR